MKNKKGMVGFTLIELIITIALVVILSLVATPMYKNHILNAKVSEGYALIGQIMSSQQNYYSSYEYFLKGQHGNVSGSSETSTDEVLGINALPNLYFTKFRVGENATKNGYTAIVYSKEAGSITSIFNMTASSKQIWNH